VGQKIAPGNTRPLLNESWVDHRASLNMNSNGAAVVRRIANRVYSTSTISCKNGGKILQ